MDLTTANECVAASSLLAQRHSPYNGTDHDMSDAEMHAFLNASCHVERCEIKAQALFDAAVFATPTV